MVSPSARSASASHCRTERSKRFPPACPAIASACASSRPSRCSTCCANVSTRCPEVTRAFVAVQLPPAVLGAISERNHHLKLRGARTMTRDQWHLTLQFLGNNADVDTVVDALGGFAELEREVPLITRHRPR